MGVIVWLILLAVVAGGCGRLGQTTTDHSASATEAAATTNPATEPAGTILDIEGQSYSFPAAILRLSSSGGHLHARLFTDDPPQAIEANYHGNSFDLPMTLGISDVSELQHAVWTDVESDPSEQHESSRGIFLDGQRKRLHEQDDTVKFNPEGDKVNVVLEGWFLLYENSAKDNVTIAPVRVYVKGDVAAKLIEP